MWSEDKYLISSTPNCAHSRKPIADMPLCRPRVVTAEKVMNDFKRVEQSTYNKMGKLQVKVLHKRNQKFFRLTKYNGKES